MRVTFVGDNTKEEDGYNQSVMVEVPNVQGMADLLEFFEACIGAVGFTKAELTAQTEWSTWTSEGRIVDGEEAQQEFIFTTQNKSDG